MLIERAYDGFHMWKFKSIEAKFSVPTPVHEFKLFVFISDFFYLFNVEPLFGLALGSASNQSDRNIIDA